MSDQAENLRESLRRREDGIVGARAHAVSAHASVVVCGASGCGATVLTSQLAIFFARGGIKVWAVGPELFESLGSGGCLRASLWTGSQLSQAPFGPGLLPEADLLLADVHEFRSENPCSILVVLGPGFDQVDEVIGKLRYQRRYFPFLRMAVIVNRVTAASQGREIYYLFRQEVSRFFDGDVEYLGHITDDENLFQAVRNQKFLLDLNAGAPAARSLSMVGKRLSESVSERQLGEVKGIRKLRKGQPEKGIQFLFKKANRLWKAWSGEVKA